MSWTLWKERWEKGTLLVKSDPELLFSMVRSKIQTAFFPLPAKRVVKQIDGVSMELELSSPQTKAMYYDAYEPATVRVMKRILKPGDTFIDVGASIGYLSAVAAGLVGREGQVHSFEPSPSDFERLQKFSQRNPSFQISVHPFAAGDAAGEAELQISNLRWVGWNTLVPGFMRANVLGETQKVPIIRLDEYLLARKESLGKVSLIKIDTEGYEFKVLRGLQGFFEAFQGHLPAIICELTPRVHALMGTTLREMSDYMKDCGYQAFSLLDQKTEVDITQLKSLTDIFFWPQN